MAYPHYSRAPIVEAVIDLRVSAAVGIDISRLQALATSLSAQFPVQNAMFRGQFAVALSTPPAAEAPSEVSKEGVRGFRLPVSLKAQHDQIGVRLASNSNSRVLQLTANGFTYSHLAPYSSWKEFRAEALPLWDSYVAAVVPDVVTRCALRYINRLSFKGPSVEPEEYLNLYPTLPKGIPPDITGMFMQLRMPQEDLDAMAILNLTLTDPETDDAVSMLLDFDVFNLSERKPSDQVIWTVLDALDDRKNLLFNECLTQKSKEMYL
jgi:uncharacterized protein (TIGR04255 family)